MGTVVTFHGTNAELAAPEASFAPQATLRTDARGEVVVMVRFGQLAGPATIEAYVPTLQAFDTLRLEVLPGRTVGPTITVSESIVLVGVPVQAKAIPADRYGNATGEQIPLVVESAVFRQEDGGLVAHRLGEAQLSAVFEGHVERVTIKAVPDGQIAAGMGETFFLMSLDGVLRKELFTIVPNAAEGNIDWDESGRRIVVGERQGFAVFDFETGRLTRTGWPEVSTARPKFSPDGLIHFSAVSSAFPRGDWEIRWATPDGSEHGVTIPVGRFPNNDFYPDWHPDGRRFVFTADWEDYRHYLLRIYTAATDSITTLDVEGTTPAWSPDGTLIAYQNEGTVGVMAPDGTDHRSWNVDWSRGVAWSPDGQALIGIVRGRLAVLDVLTGETVTLWHLGGAYQNVDWRPALDP